MTASPQRLHLAKKGSKKPRRAADRPTDWLTIRTEKHARTAKGRTVADSWKNIARLESRNKAVDDAFFVGTVQRLRKRADTSRAWLEKRGWQLVGGQGNVRRLWFNANGDRPRYSDDAANSTAEEKTSFEIFQYADTAVWFAERGDWNRAIHFAYLAGFATGLSHARVRQSEQKRGRRRSSIRDEAMQRLRALAKKESDPTLANLRPAQIARRDSWFARIGKGSLREILRAFRKA
jgi:hypothetical protein